MEEKTYSLHDMAEFTGLTERTLRNYLNQGLLRGEKRDGAWRFTAQQLAELLRNPTVRPSIQAKAASYVYDFLLDEKSLPTRYAPLWTCARQWKKQTLSAAFSAAA